MLKHIGGVPRGTTAGSEPLDYLFEYELRAGAARLGENASSLSHVLIQINIRHILTAQSRMTEREMDHDDYLRGQAAEYRRLAQSAQGTIVKMELLELAAACEEIANNLEDLRTAG
jgi:hypothetical protein